MLGSSHPSKIRCRLPCGWFLNDIKPLKTNLFQDFRDIRRRIILSLGDQREPEYNSGYVPQTVFIKHSMNHQVGLLRCIKRLCWICVLRHAMQIGTRNAQIDDKDSHPFIHFFLSHLYLHNVFGCYGIQRGIWTITFTFSISIICVELDLFSQRFDTLQMTYVRIMCYSEVYHLHHDW